jgi:hypothetical protein
VVPTGDAVSGGNVNGRCGQRHVAAVDIRALLSREKTEGSRDLFIS